MITWSTFSSRVGLYSEPPRSAAEWNRWARPYLASVTFRSGRKWRSSKRTVGRLDSALKVAKGLLGAGWTPPEPVHGFVRGCSTVTAALPHVSSKLVLAVDLKDFYGQVTFNRVAATLAERFDDDVLAWVEGACFMDGTLPLGFRTSPMLSNLAFEDSDHAIASVASARGIQYTRWVDDLSFSGGDLDDSFLEELKGVLAEHEWRINDAKTRFMRRSPYVLGLYVGHDVSSPRVPRWVKEKVLVETYYFSKHGASHFERPGVYPRLTLLGLSAYAMFVEPQLAPKIRPRIESGLRLM